MIQKNLIDLKFNLEKSYAYFQENFNYYKKKDQ